MSACDCFLLHAKQSFFWTPFESWGVLIWLVVLSTSHILAQQTRSLLTCWGVTSLSMCIITHLHSHRVLTFTDFWRVLFILLYSLWYPGLQTPVASIYLHSRFNFSMKKSIGTFLAHSFLQVCHSHSPCFLLSPLNARENGDDFPVRISTAVWFILPGCCTGRLLLFTDSYFM